MEVNLPDKKASAAPVHIVPGNVEKITRYIGNSFLDVPQGDAGPGLGSEHNPGHSSGI